MPRTISDPRNNQIARKVRFYALWIGIGSGYLILFGRLTLGIPTWVGMLTFVSTVLAAVFSTWLGKWIVVILDDPISPNNPAKPVKRRQQHAPASPPRQIAPVSQVKHHARHGRTRPPSQPKLKPKLQHVYVAIGVILVIAVFMLALLGAYASRNDPRQYSTTSPATSAAVPTTSSTSTTPYVAPTSAPRQTGPTRQVYVPAQTRKSMPSHDDNDKPKKRKDESDDEYTPGQIRNGKRTDN